MTTRIAVADGIDELRLALASDRAFEAWYQRTLPRVYAYLFSRCGNDATLAEELSQQTFVAAVDQRSRFDGRSDTVTWLCGIARHKLADHFRAVEREERRQMRLEVARSGWTRRQSRRPGSTIGQRIADALRSLPAAQRAVLAFVVLDDLPVAEAARLMGKSVSATQSLLHRARDRTSVGLRGSRPMTDERMDALLRRLDVAVDPSADFVARSAAVLVPQVRRARSQDATRFGRARRDLRTAMAGRPWGIPPMQTRLAVVLISPAHGRDAPGRDRRFSPSATAVRRGRERTDRVRRRWPHLHGRPRRNGPLQITAGSGTEFAPAFSPDGTQIAFRQFYPGEPLHDPQLANMWS